MVLTGIGVNDIGRDGSRIDATERTLREVLATIRGRLPSVPIILLRTAPGRGSYATMSPALRRYNDRVQAVATDLGLRTIDLHALFAGPDGLLRPELSSDGLHWTTAAYALLQAGDRAGRGRERPRRHPAGPAGDVPDHGGRPARSTSTTRPWARSSAPSRAGRASRRSSSRTAGSACAGAADEAWISATYARRVSGLAGTLPGQ